MESARRAQRDRTETTIAALRSAAFALFGDQGYEATSLDAISTAAGVTKGALYHHFPKGKPELFEAVVDALQERMVAAMKAAASGADPLRGILDAYFDIALEPRVYRITLQDAPAVFGLERWREIEHRHALAFIQSRVNRLLEASAHPSGYGDMLSAILFGAACEATLTIAGSSNPRAARKQAIDMIAAMFEKAVSPG